MYKTRRFKALNGAKGRYSSVVDKIAVYGKDGKQLDCCVIQKDKDGREYYYPNNPHEEMGLFLGRPKDAIECIRNDFGDGFSSSYLFGMSLESVVRFIDRKYGEAIRQKTLEGWKNAKFAYGVSFGFLNSFNGGRNVCKNKCLFGYGDKPEDVMTFDTYRAAHAFIDDVNEKAEQYAEEYIKLPKTNNRDYDYKNTYQPFFNKIKGRMENGTDSIYWYAFRGIAHKKQTGQKEYEMEVVQVVLQ